VRPQPETIEASRRVLLIDDDEEFADSLADVLEARGFEVRASTDPQAAAGLAADFQPVVAMIDIHLGSVSGLDVLKRLKTEKPDLVCVMITAHAETETAVAAIREGAYDYFQKTAHPSELYPLLDRAFQHHGLSHAHKLAQQEVLQQSLRFGAALNNMSQGLCMFDAAAKLTVCNRRFAEMYGLPPELTDPGTAWLDIIAHVSTCYSDLALHDVLAEHRKTDPFSHAALYTRVLRDGRIILISHQPLTEGGWIATHEDITERRKAEARIAHMAHHDALTDLPNRILFREIMDQALARARRGETFAVLCIDLDRFKETNDTLGHPIGDRLLTAAAARLAGCVRDVDTVARLGGDEFAIIQPSVARAEDSSALARRILEALEEPFEIEGHQIIIGASLGIVMSPQDGDNPDQLLRNADIALYRAKADGRGTFRFFEAVMDARLQARRALELDLRKGLASGEFALHYQPLVDILGMKINSCEALLRWNHPMRGMIGPGEFISLAEETGLIVPLGEWALRAACWDALRWPGDVKVAVNLSACQFRAKNLVQIVRRALDDSGLPASRLELEITESILLDDDETNIAMLHEIRALGVQISMDDFGTGYSSLSYLRSFPFDKIKIDQMFIRDLQRRDAQAIVQAVVTMGSTLGMITTAEGVETEAQLREVAAMGCTEFQGYFFSRPLSPSQLDILLRETADSRAA